jgi:hypothetical protein
LNKITPDARISAATEVKAGKSVSLDLPLNAFTHVLANRIRFQQKMIDFKKMGAFIGHDDELHFNTQSSSQWDGLTHCAVQETELYYNGLRHDEVQGAKKGQNGTHSKGFSLTCGRYIRALLTLNLQSGWNLGESWAGGY